MQFRGRNKYYEVWMLTALNPGYPKLFDEAPGPPRKTPSLSRLQSHVFVRRRLCLADIKCSSGKLYFEYALQLYWGVWTPDDSRSSRLLSPLQIPS